MLSLSSSSSNWAARGSEVQAVGYGVGQRRVDALPLASALHVWEVCPWVVLSQAQPQQQQLGCQGL